MTEFPEPTPSSRRDGVGEPVDKLVPEWKLGGDDQIVAIGFAVLLLLAGALGISKWMDDGDDADTTAAAELAEESDADSSNPELEGSLAIGATEPEQPDTDEPDTDETEPDIDEPALSGDEAPDAIDSSDENADEGVATTETSGVGAGVADAVASFDRVVSGVDGSKAILTGFVDTDVEDAEATTAARGVDGIDDVDNQLVIIEPEVERALVAYPGAEASVTDGIVLLTGFVDDEDGASAAELKAVEVDGVMSIDNQLVAVQPGVVAALEAAGVVGVDVDVTLLSATARGEIADESDRQTALDAVAAVPGVVSVVDEMTVTS